MASTSKRPRSPTPPLPSEPASKAQRTPSPAPNHLADGQRSSQQHSLISFCTLPPTCDPPRHAPTRLAADPRAIERHHQMYHANVCGECDAVFPEAIYLELHQTENHDPIAAMRKDKGEKIFGCFISSCDRHFLTPKTRRLHLIQAHGYHKQFFFSVTNKGVAELLRRYGEGASLIRGAWKPRADEGRPDGPPDLDGDIDSGGDEEHSDRMESDVPEPPSPAVAAAVAATKTAPTTVHNTIRPAREAPPHLGLPATADDRAPSSRPRPDPPSSPPSRSARRTAGRRVAEYAPRPSTETAAATATAESRPTDADVDDLAGTIARMDLASVPGHVRFGRGASGRGFSSRGVLVGSARGRGKVRSSVSAGGSKGSEELEQSALTFVPHSVKARGKSDKMVV